MLCDADLDPLFWDNLRAGQPSAWHGHVPFAHWLVAATRPRSIVELGTHAGVSYSAFCQAVQRSDSGARCHAVDTWAGDAHAGAYDEAVYAEFSAFNAAHFAGFSTLIRKTFDDALADFADGSIDLLHIDGFHTYEAVRHDFESWRPKLSNRAVVLFHDICVRERGFGVWQFWEEIRGSGSASLEFHHSFGLGVLALGPVVPEALRALCDAPAERMRTRFAALGERHTLAADKILNPASADEPQPALDPLIDPALDPGTIFIAERFAAPPGVHALRLPRDAVTRGAKGCTVWVVAAGGQDWRQGDIRRDPVDPVVTLRFSAFPNRATQLFHLFVTDPCPAGQGLPPRLAALLLDQRAPIALDTPMMASQPPSRALVLDGAEAGEPALRVVCDYANAWRDIYGAYLSGWTHCGSDPVTHVALVLGERRVELELEPRADVLVHYPECAPAMPVGWRGYIEGLPGLALQLSVSTATATRLITPELPERLTRPPPVPPMTPALQLRFVEMVNAEALSVLEIGARIVGPETIVWRHRMPNASRYVGLDIHPSANVDLVADAHHLTAVVEPGSFDAIWSVDTIEHLQQPWLAAAEINRALRLGGITLHIAPHTWPVHEAPADYFRFSEDGLGCLFGPAFGFEVIAAELVEPMAIYPVRRDFPQCEMPLHPGYGHAVILARKVAELPPRAALEQIVSQQLGDSRIYPDSDRAAREQAERDRLARLARA